MVTGMGNLAPKIVNKAKDLEKFGAGPVEMLSSLTADGLTVHPSREVTRTLIRNLKPEPLTQTLKPNPETLVCPSCRLASKVGECEQAGEWRFQGSLGRTSDGFGRQVGHAG